MPKTRPRHARLEKSRSLPLNHQFSLWPSFPTRGLETQIHGKLVPELRKLVFDILSALRATPLKTTKTTKSGPWPSFPTRGLETQIRGKLVPELKNVDLWLILMV